MAIDISQKGGHIDIYLSAPSSAYERYHITGLTGSMYVTKPGNLGASFKYHFSIYTDSYYVYTGETYERSKPTSLNTIARFSDYCNLYVGGDDGYPALYGSWVNDSNRAVIDNASLVFDYTPEYRAKVILNYNGGTYAGQSSKDFGYSNWTTDSSIWMVQRILHVMGMNFLAGQQIKMPHLLHMALYLLFMLLLNEPLLYMQFGQHKLIQFLIMLMAAPVHQVLKQKLMA